MKKYKLLQDIDNAIQVIKENPELFHDGIDEELVSLLVKVFDYIFKGE